MTTILILKKLRKKSAANSKTSTRAYTNQHPEYPDYLGKSFCNYDLTSAFGNSSQHINGFSCELARIEHPFRRIGGGGGVQIYPGVLLVGEVITLPLFPANIIAISVELCEVFWHVSCIFCHLFNSFPVYCFCQVY